MSARILTRMTGCTYDERQADRRIRRERAIYGVCLLLSPLLVVVVGVVTAAAALWHLGELAVYGRRTFDDPAHRNLHESLRQDTGARRVIG